jgi:deazaflavin-dependent oxidoreductase (nitroreductase family)
MIKIVTINKYIINPLFRHLAGKTNTWFALVYHVGRKSGKTYQTPIIVRQVDEGFIVALTYGPTASWYQNVLAAKKCKIFWHRKKYAIQAVEMVTQEQGLQAFPPLLRNILKLRAVKDFIVLKTDKH